MRTKLCLFLLPPLLWGCITFHVKKLSDTPGISNCYHLVSDKDKESIVFLSNEAKLDTTLKNNGKIYAINAKQLLDCIKNYDSCLLYNWSWNCSSPHCILLSACENYCRKYNYKLFVFTTYYEFPTMQTQSSGLSFPLLVVNHQYYGTRYKDYIKQFYNEICGSDYYNHRKNRGKRFMVFKKGKFERAVNEIELLN